MSTRLRFGDAHLSVDPLAVTIEAERLGTWKQLPESSAGAPHWEEVEWHLADPPIEPESAGTTKEHGGPRWSSSVYAALLSDEWRRLLPGKSSMAPFEAPPEGGVVVIGSEVGVRVVTRHVCLRLTSNVVPQGLRDHVDEIRPLDFCSRLYAGRLHLQGADSFTLDSLAEKLETIEQTFAPTVEWIELDDYEHHSTRTGNEDPRTHETDQWHVIEARAAWRAGGGRGATVGIVDEGFEPRHRDLEPVLRSSGYIDNRSNFHRGIANMPRAQHGTECAGMACARANSWRSQGIAPHAGLRLVAIGSKKIGRQSRLARALAFAAPNAAPDPSEPATRALSCSIGPGLPQRPLRNQLRCVLEELDDRGIPVFWAVCHGRGHASEDKVIAHPAVVGVGAVTPRRELFLSVSGEGLEFVAPGANVYTTTIWDHHPALHRCRVVPGGTSLAAPVAAGLAAVISAKYGELRPEQVLRAMRSGCTRYRENRFPYQNGRNPHYGYGILNARRALRHAERAWRDRTRPAVLAKTSATGNKTRPV